MDWGFGEHGYRVGSQLRQQLKVPAEDSLREFTEEHRKHIEPWLSAVFQAEHLNLLVGSGFTTAIGCLADTTATGMAKVEFGSNYDAEIEKHAAAAAKTMGRGEPNIEDQFRSALALLEGMGVACPEDKVNALKSCIDQQMSKLLASLLETESGIRKGNNPKARERAEAVLLSFLLSFASRAASRERLHIFTTNYDRLIEHGCDLAGLRVIDRFVGALNPVFRASRVEVDLHYNPPGIRGEPRYMEGVVRLSKLHGSLDWYYDKGQRRIVRKGLPFGAPADHTDVPKDPVDTVMIYPNPAKDMETAQYPYAELFRDFAAAICRPNVVVVSYGYGFGDDHINRVLLDMLTIPSTHLVIIAYEGGKRLKKFCSQTRDAQVSLLVGSHFANLATLVENYLPKPALDHITTRMFELQSRRPSEDQGGATPSAEPATPSAEPAPPEIDF